MASYDMAGFIEIVKNRAEELDSEYRDKPRDTDELYEFLEGNDWFGTLTEDDGCSTVTMNEELEKRLDICFSCRIVPDRCIGCTALEVHKSVGFLLCCISMHFARCPNI